MAKKRVLTDDPERLKVLQGQLSRMMKNIQSSGGDTTYFDNNEALTDETRLKTVKATRQYLKDNQNLNVEYPELYRRNALNDSQSVYVEGLDEVRKPPVATPPLRQPPAKPQTPPTPIEDLPTLKLGAGRSKVRDTLRNLFGGNGSVQPTPRLGKNHLGWSR